MMDRATEDAYRQSFAEALGYHVWLGSGGYIDALHDNPADVAARIAAKVAQAQEESPRA